MNRTEFRDLVSPETAHDAIRSLDIGGEPEHVPLDAAAGRVLATRVDADLDVPGFDRAALDGYALRASDTFDADEADPASLSLVGAVHAGERPEVTVEAGEAVEISTGAVMPDGADAMVPVERTDETDDSVLVRTSVAPGDNVTFAGADVAAGDRALGHGTHLTPREIGLLSALGVERVAVEPRPRVGIVSTGDELVPPGETLDSERGQIYDVNAYTIAAAVADAGGEPVRYPHVGDDWDEMERVLHRAADECDLVCSSGSTSASAVDVIYRVIDERGELMLHGVAVKPGKPMLVGRLGEAGFVGLPGYPVSAMLVFRTFVAPAVREAAGLPAVETASVTGRLAVEERFAEGRRRLLPVGLVEVDPAAGTDWTDSDETTATDSAEPSTTDLLVYPVDRGSGATTSLTYADGVVTVPAETDYLACGERVTVYRFSSDVRPPALLGIGEADPTVDDALDQVANSRYLSVGTRPALRRLREGIPDVVVLAGPLTHEVDGEELVSFDRTWGLAVSHENSTIASLEDLLDETVVDGSPEADSTHASGGVPRFANLTADSGLRRSFDAALEDLTAHRDCERATLERAIDGYGTTLRGLESPARRVLRGEADAGLTLRETANRLGLGFVPVAEQPVRVVAARDRARKPGVQSFAAALEDVLDGPASGD